MYVKVCENEIGKSRGFFVALKYMKEYNYRCIKCIKRLKNTRRTLLDRSHDRSRGLIGTCSHL